MQYLKLYTSYKNLFYKLNVFQFKDLIFALLDYVESKEVREFKNKKVNSLYLSIIQIINKEKNTQKQKKSIAGKEGAKKRWKKQENGMCHNSL